ncbi:unnamed protein product [Amoebophrya sp. A120]|nr:unnamed protein product [Amoebophrya sp. A120]|eukprot:GSA120T00015220001.1
MLQYDTWPGRHAKPFKNSSSHIVILTYCYIAYCSRQPGG